MARPAVVFFTYMFANNDEFQVGTTLGFNTAQYCGYIEKFFTEDIEDKKVNFYFPDIDEFQFMKSASDITTTDGGGWNAQKLFGLYQIIDTATASLSATTEYNPENWKIIDLTPQTLNYSSWSATTINKTDLIGSLYIVSESEIDAAPSFVLNDHIIQPSTSPTDLRLGFGEEQFLFGNISTQIASEIYRTEFNIVLDDEYYNTSQNPTWDNSQSVFFTEVGIYNNNDELVAVGKINYPIDKTATSSRTLTLELDF